MAVTLLTSSEVSLAETSALTARGSSPRAAQACSPSSSIAMGPFSDPPPLRPPPLPQACDAYFDAACTSSQTLPLYRSRYSYGGATGTPRTFPNAVTAFIDGSAIYGSDYSNGAAVAAATYRWD